jgi:macrolide-specific efflux system membrane fusion protein
MTVQTQVSEADVSRLKVGMPVYFTTLGDQRKRWYGTLRQINPTPDVVNNVVLYNALFDVPNAEGRLMTQMTTQVFFVVAEAKDAVLVPMTALTRTGKGNATVQVVGTDGAPQTREVQIGASNRVMAQIVSGLEPGERVATADKPQRNARSASAAPTPKMGPRL